MKKLKLNIQLFGASNSSSTTLSSTSGNTATLTASFTETSVNSSENTSNISATATITLNSGSYSVNNGPTLVLYFHNNVSGQTSELARKTVNSMSRGDTVTISGSDYFYHNSDGTGSGYVGATWVHNGSSIYIPNSGSTESKSTNYTTIARGFSSNPTVTFQSKDETSMTFKWATSEKCSTTQYNINNAGWVDYVSDANATSGTIKVPNLSPNTQYYIQFDFKKRDSGMWASTKPSYSGTTYDYPKITTVYNPSLTIINNSNGKTTQKLKIDNPLGTSRTYKIRMYYNSISDSNKLYESPNYISTNGDVSFDITNSTMYGKIPETPEGNCIYVVYCNTTNTTKQTEAGKNKFIAVKENGNTPTITICSIKDTTNQSLTGSADKMIVNLSKPTISVTANAKNSAYIKSIKVVNNNTNIVNGAYSSGASNTGSGTASSAITSNSFTVTIVDSRNFDYTQTYTPSSVTYIPLTISPTIVRNQPTDGKVNMSYSGNFFNASFGSVTNTLTVKWKVKQSGGSYGNLTDVSPTSSEKSSNNYTKNVGTLSDTYDYTKDYVFYIEATDKIKTVSQEVFVSKGVPIFWWNGSSFNVNGTLNVNSKDIVDLIYPVGSIYVTTKITNPATLFGKGTWARLQSGFLYASSATSGDTGGSGNGTGTSTGASSGNTGASSGNTGASSGNTGSTTLTGAQSGIASHSHQYKGYWGIHQEGTANRTVVAWNTADDANGGYTRGAGNTNATSGHTHSLNSHTHSLNSHTHSLNSHTHTIPYITVYVWKRTA